MSLLPVYGPGKFGLSFELFPPKTAAGEESLFGHVEQLMAFSPSYITCTYGAGGSTRTKTLDIVEQVRKRYGIPVASHLTCVGSTVDQLRQYLAEARQRGVGHVVALRGDPPQGDSQFRPVPGGLRYANELVTLIRAEFPDLGVAVAGYPEMHREAPSP
ncbi:MAG: methylenetetrahydrofolate reductase, partial [Pirellulaceae bacterium]